MQFVLWHLMIVTACMAIVFALCRFHPAAALLCCPIVFGPVGGYWVAKSVEGAVIGFLSAVFWCVLLGFFGAIVLFTVLFLLGSHSPSQEAQTWTLVVGVIYLCGCSLLGGYIGGKVADS